MSLALRPYVTAGVALVGASVIAATPISPPPIDFDAALPQVSTASVELTAAVDPIAAWANLFTHTPENLLALGNLIAKNPAPILGQIVANWSGYGQTLGTALQTAGTALSTYLTITLPTALQKFSNQLMSGDMQGAAQTFVDAITSLAYGAGLPMLNVFSIPVHITQNFANVVATLGPNLMGVVANVGLSAVAMVVGTSYAAGDSARAVVDAIKDGDPVGAFNALAAMPAIVADALINGYDSPARGILAPGLLSFEHPPTPDTPPWEGWWSDGPIARLLNSRLTIAKAIGWQDPATPPALSGLFGTGSKATTLSPKATVPDAVTAPTVTLSTDPAPAAPETETASPESAATEDVTPKPAKQAATSLVRQSLVATPGKPGALGTTNKPAEKVASDVRDGISATVNKIGESVKKAFAKPEKKSASASTGADKNSGSGSSGDAK
ncbi:hypothetical protein [Mycobacterium sp. NPDC004974]